MLEFIDAVHESLELEKIGTNYMETITNLVRANAYGFYLFRARGEDLVRVAVHGGVERYVRRYEQYAYRVDPLLRYLMEKQQPICETQLFTEQEWQEHPFRRALTMRRLVRMLEAPLLHEGEPLGSLFFTRRPDEPPFCEAEMRVMRTVTLHVTAAVRNALDYQRACTQRDVAEHVLDVIGSALILSDTTGNIRFVNKQAEQFLAFCGDLGAQRDRLRRAIRENVKLLTDSGVSTALSVVPAAPRPTGTGASILLRSVRVPGAGGTVATFLCSRTAEGLRMNHLAGLIPPRELEVLELVAQGLSNKEIAARMIISENTVKYHLKRLFQIFGAVSRADLLAKATAYRPGEDAPLPMCGQYEPVIV